jgi:hypothetical protein
MLARRQKWKENVRESPIQFHQKLYKINYEQENASEDLNKGENIVL